MVSLFTEDEPLAALALFQRQLSDSPDLTHCAEYCTPRTRQDIMHDARQSLHTLFNVKERLGAQDIMHHLAIRIVQK